MSKAKGIRQAGYFDCAGGGQVVVEGTTAFIGHMRNPHGTSAFGSSSSIGVPGPAMVAAFASASKICWRMKSRSERMNFTMTYSR